MINGEALFCEYDNYPSPVLVTNSDGTIVYKNKTSKHYGSYRKGSCIAKYIYEQEKQAAIDCILAAGSGIFRLMDVVGCSYACIVPYGKNADFRVVAVVPGIVMLVGGKDSFTKNNIENTMRCRLKTLRDFEQSIKSNASNAFSSQRFEKLISISNMLLFRSVLHNSVALDRVKTIQSHNLGSKALPVNISLCISEILKICIPYCVSLGFRVITAQNIENMPFPIYAQVEQKDFISVFTSCLTMALRLSSDAKCNYKSFCESDCMYINFDFNAKDQSGQDLKEERCFLKDASVLNNWGFSLTYSQNQGCVSLMIPTCDNRSTTLHQKTEPGFKQDGAIIQIINSELAILEEIKLYEA